MPGPWGDAVRHLLVAKKWSQATLARQAGLAKNTVGAIAKGRHTLTSNLQAIADALNVPIEDVLIYQGALPKSKGSDITPVSTQAWAGHESNPFVQGEGDQELRRELSMLKDQIATVAAEQEIERRRRKRVSGSRRRKSAGSANARRSR